MRTLLPLDPGERLDMLLDMSWEVFFAQVVSGRTKVNREASMQLHLAGIIGDLGKSFCVLPEEFFHIEMETRIHKANVDITCCLQNATAGSAKAALELKCFRKDSKRATDLDLYDSLKDIERLDSYPDLDTRRFICLTDNTYYAYGTPGPESYAAKVTIRDGTCYPAGSIIIPPWKGSWKDTSRDKDISIAQDLNLRWTTVKGWSYLYVKR